MFKVNNKDTRTTPTYFTPYSSVSIVHFEHVIAAQVGSLYECSSLSQQFSFFFSRGVDEADQTGSPGDEASSGPESASPI